MTTVRRYLLELPPEVHAALQEHLLPAQPEAEEAAFVFARAVAAAPLGETVFRCLDWEVVSPEGFAHRSLRAIELSDETRARIIKRAHDLQSSIVEFHSHPFPYPAEFSASDHFGLELLVPHVRWRLKQRPYVAVVVAPDSFDGLVWATDQPVPHTLESIVVGEKRLRPTGLSRRRWEQPHV